MRRHHTKTKGTLGVLKAKVSLFEQGWLVLVPESDYEEFDLVAYKDGQFRRIQVKYCAIDKTNTIYSSFQTVWHSKEGNHILKTDKSKVDVWCIYCPNTDACYYLNPKDFQGSVTLRFDLPQNGQLNKAHMAQDFLKMF